MLLIILLNVSINSQTILEKLDSPDYSVRLNALIEIRDNDLTEYTNDLLERTFEQPTLFLTHFFVDVLFILEYGDIGDIIYQFIDICDEFPQEDPLYFKVEATELLFKLGDYNTVEYVFEYINQDPLKNSQKFIDLLKEIAFYLPQYSEVGKDLLVNIKENSESYLNRRLALQHLILLFGENNLKDEIHSTIINDPNSNMRKYALEHYNFSDRKELLRQQIENDSHRYRRIKYSEIYLENYGEPEDLEFIKEYLLIEPDELARRSITLLTIGFVPPRITLPDYIPHDEYSLSKKIDIFISYTEDLFLYEWIEEETYKYYKHRLNLLLYQVEEENFEEMCSIIDEDLLERIEEDFNNSGTLTIEGYKFLHFHTIYIREDFEDEFGLCE